MDDVAANLEVGIGGHTVGTNGFSVSRKDSVVTDNHAISAPDHENRGSNGVLKG